MTNFTMAVSITTVIDGVESSISSLGPGLRTIYAACGNGGKGTLVMVCVCCLYVCMCVCR